MVCADLVRAFAEATHVGLTTVQRTAFQARLAAALASTLAELEPTPDHARLARHIRRCLSHLRAMDMADALQAMSTQ
jgi:hypothetical protein